MPAQHVSSLLARLMLVIARFFFREIDVFNLHKVPDQDPCIFVVAPHSNQFIDPFLILNTVKRKIGFVAAAASLRRKYVGKLASSLDLIPVERPQDIMQAMPGKVSATAEQLTKLLGKDTIFTMDSLKPGAILVVNDENVVVEKVISPTEILLKAPGLSKPVKEIPFKFLPKVDQSEVLENVFKFLSSGNCVGIFPEGGSHDRTELLPLKPGFALMALGAMSKHPNLNLSIIPVGLNYFHPHRFRSSAFVDIGSPIKITKEWVEMYNKGGEEKRKAVSEVMDKTLVELRRVTVSAEDYQQLSLFRIARRLYKPTGVSLSSMEKLQLTQSFAKAYKLFGDNPEVRSLMRETEGYMNLLKLYHLEDYQVKKLHQESKFICLSKLVIRAIELSILLFFSIPGYILGTPIVIIARSISKQKAKEALAKSRVKVLGKDVVGTWKLLTCLVVIPIFWLLYSCIGTYIALSHYSELFPTFFHQILLWCFMFFSVFCSLMGAIRLNEVGRPLWVSLRPLWMALFSSSWALEIQSKRSRLQDKIRQMAEELGPQMDPDWENKRIIQREQFELENMTLGQTIF
eukprot:Lithocolla_globosa_v1_NODE_1554_length_2490_cov_13.344559.p1 type:complete len:573 gc:universal NODE_1554_length_2490_cov_13.344559:589-2307(+)